MKKMFKNFIELVFNASEIVFAIFIPLGIIMLLSHVVMDALKDLCVEAILLPLWVHYPTVNRRCLRTA